MAPLYKKALLIGATSGIGEALAAKLVETGTEVIVSGRRQSALDAFVSKHGAKASAAALDMLDLASIPIFAESVISKHPDLDCVIINSGIQRPFDFTKPKTVDLNTIHDEFTTNIVAYVHLIKVFLPHLLSLKTETHLGALHTFTMNLRQQLQDGGKNVRVVEVFPPATQTELHDTKHQPDLVNGGQIGMPLDQCVDDIFAGLERGDLQFGVGYAAEYFQPDGAQTKKMEEFQKGHKQMSDLLKDFVKR